MRVAVIVALVFAGVITGGPASASASALVFAPRPSNPVGATVSLASSSVVAGKTIRFTGTGFVNDSGRGQVVTIKLDDVDILRTVNASDSGAISGTVTVPAATKAGAEHWLRFLAGSGQENDSPARSLASGYFAVTGASSSSPAASVSASASAAASVSSGNTLPKTGIDAGPLLAGTIALPIAGIALLLIERRRRRASA
ncbi:hypothetical protein FB565_002258 [Actinoplanes lutulentus]|uniref:LPXTG-motif cell wall-anchored protein n=1 Tax=Actinoplanes lutulentus TaxID=1287878 RepID=A0A327ZCK2_9ACTN|nr:hypothetical protein [Actinoplanes lutulentus]MBB2942545.1 hypothetical protein [Actinoplanes lutulentus]RAK38126.1 hypothetical protein B0I29_10572 [Actinoplanes lutulentus]